MAKWSFVGQVSIATQPKIHGNVPGRISERAETFPYTAPYHHVSYHALHTGRFHGAVSARTSTGCVRPGYISLLQHVLATS